MGDVSRGGRTEVEVIRSDVYELSDERPATTLKSTHPLLCTDG